MAATDTTGTANYTYTNGNDGMNATNAYTTTTATTAELANPAGQRRLRILLSFGMVLLILLVLTKGREIAILRAMGATRTQIRTIFMLEGVIITRS